MEGGTKSVSFEIMCDLKAYNLSQMDHFCVHLGIKQLVSSLPCCSNCSGLKLKFPMVYFLHWGGLPYLELELEIAQSIVG